MALLETLETADAATRPLPARHPEVRLREPDEPGERWLVEFGERYFRLGADAARLLALLDGELTADRAADRLDAPWTAARVVQAVENFTRLGLLLPADAATTATTATTATAVNAVKTVNAAGTANATGPAVAAAGKPARNRRLRYHPPLTVQFTVANPAPALARLRPLTSAVLGRVGLAVIGLLLTAGVLALGAQADAVRTALSTPPGLTGYLAIVAALLLVTAVHEAGHGAVLTHHGEQPSRVGLMLFYLTPAFFCDVTSAWRLPRPAQRVAVALAGVLVQATAAGTAACVAAALHGGVRQATLTFSVVCYLSGVLNLLPFVKFDGYLALMSHLDIPHLRAKAMADARAALLGPLTGGRFPRALPGRGWVVPYGLACQLFPLYLVGTALSLAVDALGGLGLLGDGLLVAVLCLVAVKALQALTVTVREVRRAGGSLLRLAGGLLVTAVALTALLTQVKLDQQLPAGYARIDGRPMLVLPLGSDPAQLPSGATVRLQRRGFLAAETLGSTRLAPGRARSGPVPIAAIAPLASGLAVRAQLLPLDPATVLPDGAGAAQVELGRVSLGSRLYHRYLGPLLAQFG